MFYYIQSLSTFLYRKLTVHDITQIKIQSILKLYNVNFVEFENETTIEGAKSLNWNRAEVISNFLSPWDSKTIKKIEFKALWNYEKTFFRFKVYDSDVYIDFTDDTKNSINNSDRVELFFRSNENMRSYYCLEIDPMSRLMDFKAFPKKVFDFEWNWPPEEIEINSSIEKDYFIVEVAISLKSLKELKVLKNGKIETGIYRAKYHRDKNGNYEPSWITWIDPKTDAPNFHISSSFGLLKLRD